MMLLGLSFSVLFLSGTIASHFCVYMYMYMYFIFHYFPISSFPIEELQNHLLEFLVRVADVYRKDRRAGDFIPDVLQLKVSQLFSADTEAGLNGESLVGEKFSEFLKVYIQRNNLRPELMSRIQEIIGYVPENEPTAFHWIILNVICSVRLISIILT